MNPAFDPIPNASQLLEIERRARREGTAIARKDLLGVWRLDQVWRKGMGMPDPFAGTMLRWLGARLEIGAGPGEGDLTVANAVNLGALALRFTGDGSLQGRRPLLRFRFERLRLSLGPRVIIDRHLSTPPPQKMPFFALIAASTPSDGNTGWLAARGRSGGLALWRHLG